nr:immunoglobulin heavy chain junction region [Macaca mulatta]MOV43283.1 immunoglobulin heavy chain junction region [Macaca mulatta]MOV43420.1 immunoglobulin heavy chain junction region [Macaca mulatta]MOV43826.1 immunoglobulin heavy chain junction region [Macaca mulatta]MOV46813.1 immunoglobulin heavy chain junction region [Macaca mulatta]
CARAPVAAIGSWYFDLW